MLTDADAWMVGGYPDVTTSTLPTATPISQLDVSSGGVWDWAKNSLSGMLDAYTSIEVAKATGQMLPAAGVPVGYMRTGTGQLVPAGTYAPQGSGMNSTSMLVLAVGLVAVWF